MIFYERPDLPGERASHYRLLEIKGVDELKVVMSEALGLKAVVRKLRQLFLWRDVRIHLDEVDGLGCFIELEAVARPGSDLSDERAKVASLQAEFEIEDANLVAASYCDLMSNPDGLGEWIGADRLVQLLESHSADPGLRRDLEELACEMDPIP